MPGHYDTYYEDDLWKYDAVENPGYTEHTGISPTARNVVNDPFLGNTAAKLEAGVTNPLETAYYVTDPNTGQRTVQTQDISLGTSGSSNEAAIIEGLRSGSIDPNDIYARIIRDEQRRYEQFYQPVEDQLIASLDDTSVIDNARERAQNINPQLAAARAARQASRYGQGLTPIQQREFNAAIQRNNMLSASQIVNDARIDQDERNRGVRNEIINIGRGVATQAQEGLAIASEASTGRAITNRNAAAQARQARSGALTSIGTSILTAALFV